MLLTKELYESIAQAEIAGIRNTIATVARLYPEAGVQSIDVAGGVAAFAGGDSPFSKAFGVGTLAPASDGDVAQITEFYLSRNATPRVFVSPFTAPLIVRGLVAAGYAPVDYDNILVAADPDAHALRDDRIVVAKDLNAWVYASVKGFAERRNVVHGDLTARIVGSSRDVVALEARVGDSIVATAALSVRGERATLFAGSTLPEHRHRGWQIALIRDRIARAREAGARVIYAAATPAGTSERNFHRCGFTTLYTRTRWDWQTKTAEKIHHVIH